MTIFGPDLSSYQDGVNAAALPYPFVIAKVTEGTYYTDRDYPIWRGQAVGAGKVFAWYHFLSGEDALAQAKHTLANVGNPRLPGMLDAEPAGKFSPSLAQMIAYVDAARSVGLNLRLIYLPRWYWQQIGSPGLSALADRGLQLVSSAYPGGSGYPGDGAAGWQSYGGMTPVLYQYTSTAPVQGQSVDMNAFRGSIFELAAALTTEGAEMGSYTMGPGWQNDYPDVAAALQQHIPTGLVVDDGDAAAYAMVRSFVAAERAGVLEAKVDQVLQLLRQPASAPAPVDVSALAAALVGPLAAVLAPHIGASADEIAQVAAEPVAHAVVMELGHRLQAG